MLMENANNDLATITNERFLVFNLGEAKYAMPLLLAKEVVAFRSITKLPAASKIIKGIINLRGKIITMIDLKSKIGLVSKDEGISAASFIILDNETYSYGIIVDSIETVISISPDQIEMLPVEGNSKSSNHTDRLAKVDKKLILILNIEELILDLSQNTKQLQKTA